MFEDSPSFSTTRTCAVSNGTGAAAATAPSSADIGLNDGYSRWPVTEMMVCFNAQFGCALCEMQSSDDGDLEAESD